MCYFFILLPDMEFYFHASRLEKWAHTTPANLNRVSSIYPFPAPWSEREERKLEGPGDQSSLGPSLLMGTLRYATARCYFGRDGLERQRRFPRQTQMVKIWRYENGERSRSKTNLWRLCLQKWHHSRTLETSLYSPTRKGMNLIKISCCCIRLTAPKITICRIYSYPEFDLDEVNEDECRDQFSFLA